MSRPALAVDMDEAKPACLIVFKFRLHWNHHLIKKFSIVYRVTPVFAHDIFLKEGSDGLRRHLQEMVLATKADIVVFDLDYYYLFDFDLISSIGMSAKRILISFDDLVLHQINSINAASCDLVLTADPLSALKYREMDVNAEYLVLEASKDIYFDRRGVKEIEVLFFGSLDKADRRSFVEYLAGRGIDLCLIGPGQRFVPASELAAYINRAKVVVNFSKSDYSETTDLGLSHARQYYLQFKGRVIEAGLCGTACVSEYSPSLRLLFSEREVPDFRTQEECYEVLVRLLRNDEERQGFAERLHQRVTREFEDSIQIRAIERSIRESSSQKQQRITVPLWYWRLALRSKIRMLAKSPRMVLGELRYVFRSCRSQTTAVRLMFFLETCAWIPWHYTGRIVSKYCRFRATHEYHG